MGTCRLEISTVSSAQRRMMASEIQCPAKHNSRQMSALK
jgi:hypothetical protein